MNRRRSPPVTVGLVTLVLLAGVTGACSSGSGSHSSPPLDGAAAAQSDRAYITATLQALGLDGTVLNPAYYTGNDYCGGSHDDQGEIRMTAPLGMLSVADADRLITEARDYWKAQGYRMGSFALQAPTEVDYSRTPPVASKSHYSTVEADAHGYELSVHWTDDPLPNAKANASVTSSSPCATPVHSTG